MAFQPNVEGFLLGSLPKNWDFWWKWDQFGLNLGTYHLHLMYFQKRHPQSSTVFSMVKWRFLFCQPRVQEIVIVVSRLLQVGNVGSTSLATLLAWGLWGLPSIRQWRDWRTWCWGQLEMHENSGECTGQWYSIHNSLFGKKTSFILSKSLFTRGWTFCHQIICWSCICPRRIPDFKEVPANRLKSPSGTDEQMNESSTGAKFKMKVHFWRAQIGTNCTFYGGIDLDILRWLMKSWHSFFNWTKWMKRTLGLWYGVYPCQTVVELFQMRHISVIIVSPWHSGDPDQGLKCLSSDVNFPHPQNSGSFFFFSIARGQQQVAQSTFSNVIVFKLGIHERLDMESKRLSAWFEC